MIAVDNSSSRDEKGRAFWAALWASIEESPPIDVSEDQEWQYAFLLARRVQGILLEHGYSVRHVKRANFRDFIQQFADDHCLDGDDLGEQFWDAWEKIRTPEGIDPVAAAAVDLNGSVLDGDFSTDRMQGYCSKLYSLGVQLAGGVGGGFFLSCRKVEEVLGIDRMTANRAFSELVRSGYLAKDGQATTKTAQRYKVLK